MTSAEIAEAVPSSMKPSEIETMNQFSIMDDNAFETNYTGDTGCRLAALSFTCRSAQ